MMKTTTDELISESEEGCVINIIIKSRKCILIHYPDKENKTVERCDILFIDNTPIKCECYVELKSTLCAKAYHQLRLTINEYSTVPPKDRCSFIIYKREANPRATSSVQVAKLAYLRGTSDTDISLELTPYDLKVT